MADASGDPSGFCGPHIYLALPDRDRFDQAELQFAGFAQPHVT